MKNYKIKKLYHNFASVRDYIIKKCLKKQEGIIIEYKGKIMAIPYNKLKTFQLHTRRFKSKFNDKTYELIDFRFIPDNINEKQMRLFK